MSYHFGLHPWDLDNLTIVEVGYYLDALKQIEKE